MLFGWNAFSWVLTMRWPGTHWWYKARVACEVPMQLLIMTARCVFCRCCLGCFLSANRPNCTVSGQGGLKIWCALQIWFWFGMEEFEQGAKSWSLDKIIQRPVVDLELRRIVFFRDMVQRAVGLWQDRFWWWILKHDTHDTSRFLVSELVHRSDFWMIHHAGHFLGLVTYKVGPYQL